MISRTVVEHPFRQAEQLGTSWKKCNHWTEHRNSTQARRVRAAKTSILTRFTTRWADLTSVWPYS